MFFIIISNRNDVKMGNYAGFARGMHVGAQDSILPDIRRPSLSINHIAQF